MVLSEGVHAYKKDEHKFMAQLVAKQKARVKDFRLGEKDWVSSGRSSAEGGMAPDRLVCGSFGI